VKSPLRVANSSGFYGDRLAAPREMILGGPIDVLTGDYLSELTMLILAKAQAAEGTGYAATFLQQMQDVLALARERSVRVVSNAGGLDPHGLAGKLRAIGPGEPAVAVVDGDDLRDRLPSLLHELRDLHTGEPLGALRPVLAANAYLGGWGITEALQSGAEVVVTGRVADASLVSGAAAWHFGWARDDWDALAGAVVAGHILECGAQATGGNYAFFREVRGLEHAGFPLAEIHGDGSCVITKHPGTGGAVTVGTVTAQLLYEASGPRYLHPDVVARFDTVRLEPLGPDRVRVFGARGEPAPERAKVALCAEGGFRSSMTLVLTGLDIPEKAALAERTARAALQGRVERLDVDLAGSEGFGLLTIRAMDPDPRRVGKAFTAAVVEMALASFPGLFATAPPGPATGYGVFQAATLPAALVGERLTLPDGKARLVGAPPRGGPPAAITPRPLPPPPREDDLVETPLGRVFGARSGDKGSDANLGVWARDDVGYEWLRANLSAARLAALLPECAGLPVERHLLPGLRAVNFVVRGLLPGGGAAAARPDAQAKSLGERLRAARAVLPRLR
jgi:hypothetical protein